MNLTRSLWLTFALLLLITCITLGVKLGWSSAAIIIVAAVFPDIALFGAFARHGKLRPERVRFYNALHAPVPAFAAITAGAILLAMTGHPALLLAGIAWLTHIAVDRACGFGLRESDGSVRPVGAAHKVLA